MLTSWTTRSSGNGRWPQATSSANSAPFFEVPRDMKPYSFATLLALVLLVASATGRPALAARSLDPAPAIPPLDVVVVIDQSGSMSGSGGVPASDPEALRVSAVKDLATLL